MQRAQPESQLDRYAVNELIARSNTASILRATDLRTGHDIAIKSRIRKWKATYSSTSASCESRRSVKPWITLR